MFANAFKFVNVVVTTLYNIINVSDVREVLVPTVSMAGFQLNAMTLIITNEEEFGFIRTQLQLVLVYPVD